MKIFFNTDELIHRICKELLNEASVTPTGMVWETIISTEGKGVFEKGISHSISSGSTGIILFLIEYYKQFKSEEVKTVLTSAMQSSYNYYLQHEHEIGFYNGRGGLIYALTLAGSELKEQSCYEMAKRLSLLPLTTEHTYAYNLFSGISGLLLGVLHQWCIDRDDALLHQMYVLLERLLDGVLIREQGIYWDELYFASKPLNSFLYGNSGIVFLLQQIQYVFQTQALSNIIREAIQWEDRGYDPVTRNWIDYFNERVYTSLDSVVVKTLVLSNREYKIVPSNTYSWYMGSPGTLLARKNEFELNSRYLDSFMETKEFLKKNSNPDANFTLYNGLGGILLTTLHVLPSMGADLDKHLANIGQQYDKYNHTLTSFPHNPTLADLSLLQGETGIGYLLLKLKEPTLMSSVLFPVPDVVTPSTKYDFSRFKIQPVRKFFPRCEAADLSEEMSFYSMIMSLFQREPTEDALENRLKFERFEMTQSDLNYLSEYLNTLYLDMHKLDAFKKVSLSKHCKRITSDEQSLLLVRRIGGVESHELTMLDELFVDFLTLHPELKIQKLQELVLGRIEAETPEDAEFVKQAVLERVESGLYSGILTGR